MYYLWIFHHLYLSKSITSYYGVTSLLSVKKEESLNVHLVRLSSYEIPNLNLFIVTPDMDFYIVQLAIEQSLSKMPLLELFKLCAPENTYKLTTQNCRVQVMFCYCTIFLGHTRDPMRVHIHSVEYTNYLFSLISYKIFERPTDYRKKNVMYYLYLKSQKASQYKYIILKQSLLRRIFNNDSLF